MTQEADITPTESSPESQAFFFGSPTGTIRMLRQASSIRGVVAESGDGFRFEKVGDYDWSTLFQRSVQSAKLCTARELGPRTYLVGLTVSASGGDQQVFLTGSETQTWTVHSSIDLESGAAPLVLETGSSSLRGYRVTEASIESWEYCEDRGRWSCAGSVDLPPSWLKGAQVSVAAAHTSENGQFLVAHLDAPKNATEVGILFQEDGSSSWKWLNERAVFDTAFEWGYRRSHEHMGTIFHAGFIVGYWILDGMEPLAVRYPLGALAKFLAEPWKNTLVKAKSNPILAPLAEHSWESMTCFNPAAFVHDDKVHLLYRAQGFDFVSRVGHAVSSDGVFIDYRDPDPVFSLESDRPYAGAETAMLPASHEGTSGGGWAGSEDPRVTLIDNKLVMTYVSFDGHSLPRLAMTSIKLSDFVSNRLFWEKPVFLSPPGIVDKSGVVFPEKIHGKYVIMHRIFPNIQIDYVDSLASFDGTCWLETKAEIRVRPGHWDSRKIGAGAPPIKTSEGWLLIYYGVDDRDGSRYNIGAMLLDLEDPSKVLYRSAEPILVPDEWYENSGFKPGIAYPCGAVVLSESLLIYYGAADNVVCVARAHLDEFLETLKQSGRPRVQTQFPAVQRVEVNDALFSPF